MIKGLKLNRTFEELDATEYGYKLVNTSSDAFIKIVLGKKLFDKKFIPVVRTDEGSNVLGEYTDLLEAVKKLETVICCEVDLGVWSDFAEEGLKELA